MMTTYFFVYELESIAFAIFSHDNRDSHRRHFMQRLGQVRSCVRWRVMMNSITTAACTAYA